MDEGSYGNIYQRGRNASPMTPSTPSSAYQTNINRTKTRKWVEAKTQNYDGDDWGNEYDDEEPEEPPAPMIHQAGGRVFSQPATTSAFPMRDSTALRSPSGPPALHIQTQQPTPPSNAPAASDFVSDPSSLGSASERGPTERLVSPQSASSHPYPGRPEYRPVVASPTSQNRESPAPTASRFPPRKSSITQQDIADYTGRGSRPGSSSSSTRPWMEHGSNSPNKSAGTGTPVNKPLPFVRPADIYRRMEEEKEKERRSMDSGRRSIDSVDSAGALRSPTEQRRRTSFERDDGSDTSRGVRPTLAPVAERRSEYGLDRLVANTGKSDQETASQAQGIATAPVFQTESGLEQGHGDRVNPSPRLPDLARMSGFGDDFFSSDTPVSFGDSTPKNSSPGPAAHHEQPTILPSVSRPTPADRPSSPPKASAEQAKRSRPSLPGTWVSETTTVGSPGATPMEKPEPNPSRLSQIQDAGEVSPMSSSEEEPGDMEPTTAVKHAPSLDATPKAAAKAQAEREVSREEFGAATGKHDQTLASEIVSAGPSHHATPQNLPPLQTGSPPSSSNQPPIAERTMANSREIKSATASYRDSPSDYSAGTRSRTATTTTSEFAPTAPLNPRRGDVQPLNFTAPEVIARHATMSSVDTASPNETDRLREDIIKSLSPINPPPSAGPFLTTPGTRASDTPEIPRESRYLSGVYDDYLGSTEEKSLQETGQTLKDKMNDNQSSHQPAPTPAQLPSQQRTPSPDTTSVPPKTADVQPPSLTRRFSWEQDTEEMTPSPVHEPKSMPMESENARDENKSPASAESTPLDQDVKPVTQAPVLQLDTENAGSMSHQVSQVSSRAPDALGATGLEPPSPVSVNSSEKDSTPVPSAPANEGKRMSLAEEKVLIRTSSHALLSPSPPHDEHPALSESQPDESAPTATATATSATGATPIPPVSQPKILTWREITSFPSSESRVQRFNEAREQFYSMDSGLSNWIAYMQSQSEHSITPRGASDRPQTGGVDAMPSPNEQPYYQQYLNASNSNIAAPPPQPGRASVGHLLSMGHHPQQSSGFGPPGNQVGAKSKEFLHAAGAFGNKATKSGMKLFNKGRNKLRNTGDKDSADSEPKPAPPHPGKLRNERRRTWGLISSALGARSATPQGPPRPPHQHSSSLPLIRPPTSSRSLWDWGTKDKNNHKHTNSTSAPNLMKTPSPFPPQLPLPARLSPFNSVSHGHHSPPWQPSDNAPPIADTTNTATTTELTGDSRRLSPYASVSSSHRSPPQPELVSPLSETRSSTPTLLRNSLRSSLRREEQQQQPYSQLLVPAPISENQPTWPLGDSFTGPPLLEESLDLVTPPVAAQPRSAVVAAPIRFSAAPPATQHVAHLTTDDRSDGWVEVTSSQPTSASRFTGPIDGTHRRKMSFSKATDRPNVMPMPEKHAPQEGATDSSMPQRQSSFVGLPPIRRTSTFGFMGSKKSQSDGNDSVPSPLAASEEEVPPLPAMTSTVDHHAANGQMSMHAAQSPQSPQSFAQPVAQYPAPDLLANGHNVHNSPVQQAPNGFMAGPGTVHSGYPHPQLDQGPQQMMGRGGAQPGGPQPYFNATHGQAGSPPLHGGQRMSPPGMRPQPGMSPQMAGNPVQRIPPQGMWKLQEAKLSEPLSSPRSRASSNSLNQQPGYYAYDKETGAPAPMAGGSSAQQVENAGRSSDLAPTKRQPGYYAYDKENDVDPPEPPSASSSISPPVALPQVQRVGKNSGMPPVSAARFANLFPTGGSNQPLSQSPPGHIPQDVIQPHQLPRHDPMGISQTATHEFQPGDDGKGRRGSAFNSGLLKDISGKFLHHGRGNSVSEAAGSVRGDNVSETSIIIEGPHRENKKRGSLLGLGNHAGNNDATNERSVQQNSQPFPAAEKQKTFFGAANSNQNNAGPPTMKKRFSDLKGMFKGNSSDGHMHDEPSEPGTAHSSRPSMQGQLGPGPQGPHGQQGAMGSLVPNRGRTSTRVSADGPRFADLQPEPECGQKGPSGPGSFLSGLFKDRSSSKTREPKPQPGQMPPPGQFPVQPGQFGRGQMPPPGQQFGRGIPTRGQPGFPQGQPVQGPPMRVRAESAPMMHEGQRPGSQGQPTRQLALPGDPIPSTSPGGVIMKEPPQANVPMQGQPSGPPYQQTYPNLRPGLPPQQSSHSGVGPDETAPRGPLSSNPIQSRSTESNLGVPARSNSPQPSHHSSQDHLSITGSSITPRTSAPARKPVGSGSSRQVSVSSTQNVGATQQPAPAQPKPDIRPAEEKALTAAHVETERQSADQVPAGQRNPQLGAPTEPGHMRQLSLPTPTPSPAPQASSPTSRLLSMQPVQPPASPRPQVSPHSPPQGHSVYPHRPVPGDELENPQGRQVQPGQMGQIGQMGQMGQPGQPGQPAQAGHPGQPATSPGITPQHTPPSQWNSVAARLQSGPPGQQQLPPHMQGQGRPATNPQEQPKSGISKFLGAFKKGSKQPSTHQPPQQPRPGQQINPNTLQVGQGQMAGQQIPPGMQPGTQQPHMGPGGLSPQPSFGPMPGQPQGVMQPGQGRGQMPPQQMQAGRGQMPQQVPNQIHPSLQAGRGQMPPNMTYVMQGGRGGQAQQQQQPLARKQEPQYAQVPIPRGYDAVHGYGNASVAVPSPYNIGRGTPGNEQQYTSGTQQPGMPQQQQQQWDPRMISQQSPYMQMQMQHQYQSGTPVHMMQQRQPQTPPVQGQPPPQQVYSSPPSPAPQQNAPVQPPTTHSPPHTQSPPPQAQLHPNVQNGSTQQDGQQHALMHPSNGSPQPQTQGNSQNIFVPPASTHSSTPDPESRANSVVPLVSEEPPKSQPPPQHIVTAMNSALGQPQIQHPGSPQKYPLPDSAATFSPVNPAANKLPVPPLPPAEPVQVHSGPPSVVSVTPSPPNGPLAAPPVPAPHRNVSGVSAMEEPPRSTSLSPEGIPQRTFSVSPEPPGPSPPANVDPRRPMQSPDNAIYGGTPHNSNVQPVAQYSAHQPGPKSVVYNRGEAQGSNSNGAAIAGGAAGLAAGAAVAGAVHTPMEPEEKILVDQPVELAAINDDDDLLVMTATSYPGQEWNPYGAGEFGDWE